MSDKPSIPKPMLPTTMSRHTLPPSQAQKRAAKEMEEPAAETVEDEPEMTDEEYEAWAKENPEEAENLERITIGMAKGEISPAEAFGISVQELAEAAVLGAEALEAGNLESAVIIFEGLVTAEPNVPQFRVSLGQCYERLGYTEEALDSYSSALVLYSMIEEAPIEDIVDAALMKATLLIKDGRELEALEDLEGLIPEDFDPEEASPSMMQVYGVLMNLLDKFEQEGMLGEEGEAAPQDE